MALTVTAGGGTANTTSASSVSFAAGASGWSQGDLILVIIAADNAGTDGATAITGVTDDQSNSYSLVGSALRDPGAANAGVDLQFWAATAGAGGLGATDNITVSFSPNVTAKGVHAYKIVGSVDDPSVRTSGTETTGSGSSFTHTSPSVTSGEVIFGAVGFELGANPNGTDTDTTNGSWSTKALNRAGSIHTSSMGVQSQYKITTGTGTQTFNHSLVAFGSYDYAVNTVIVKEGPSASTIEGTAAFAPASPVFAASAIRYLTGSSAFAPASPILNAAATPIHPGTAAFTPASPVLAATGVIPILAVAAFAPPSPVMAASAGVIKVATSSFAPAFPVFTAQANITHEAVATFALNGVAFTASGAVTVNGLVAFAPPGPTFTANAVVSTDTLPPASRPRTPRPSPRGTRLTRHLVRELKASATLTVSASATLTVFDGPDVDDDELMLLLL